MESEMMLHPRDVKVLQKYCKGKKVVEIGTYKGGSAEVIAKVCKKLVTIDIYPDHRPEGDFTIADVKKRLKKYKNVKVVKGDGVSEAFDYSANSIEVLFIDDGHKKEIVQREFANWLRCIKKKGIIIFHDYIEKGHYSNFGVREAVHEILETRLIEKVEVSGLCFIARKK